MLGACEPPWRALSQRPHGAQLHSHAMVAGCFALWVWRVVDALVSKLCRLGEVFSWQLIDVFQVHFGLHRRAACVSMRSERVVASPAGAHHVFHRLVHCVLSSLLLSPLYAMAARLACHAATRHNGGMRLARDLRQWFATHRRELPWRQAETTPWAVLVSEVMSQQTQVERVAARYQAWMRRWPTPAALAAASQVDVIKMWDRLGYPRRALALHQCAKIVTADYGGHLPETEADLLALPGIGPYTAAAVRAFGFKRRAVVLDTNVRRVIARLHGEAGVPAHVRKYEWARAEALLPANDEEAVQVSEALMELGALVCQARTPDCDACPLSTRCAWFAAGRPQAGAPKRKTQRYAGTHRQARGNILAALRENDGLAAAMLIARASRDQALAKRALASLQSEGFITEQAGVYRLAGSVDVGASELAG